MTAAADNYNSPGLGKVPVVFRVGLQARPGRLPEQDQTTTTGSARHRVSAERNYGLSTLKSGMDRKTARKYLKDAQQLIQPRPARDWRTRVDPLAAIWREAEPRLQAAPEWEAKALFEHLLMIRPEQMQETQLRTFQRRVRQWRLEHGLTPELIFPQVHRPGEVMQVDWTPGFRAGNNPTIPSHLEWSVTASRIIPVARPETATGYGKKFSWNADGSPPFLSP